MFNYDLLTNTVLILNLNLLFVNILKINCFYMVAKIIKLQFKIFFLIFASNSVIKLIFNIEFPDVHSPLKGS